MVRFGESFETSIRRARGVYTTFISVIAPDIMFESDTHLLIGSYMQ
jgi:hypothetical protein